LISNTPESNGFFRLEATTARYSRLPGRLIVKTPRLFNQLVYVFLLSVVADGERTVSFEIKSDIKSSDGCGGSKPSTPSKTPILGGQVNMDGTKGNVTTVYKTGLTQFYDDTIKNYLPTSTCVDIKVLTVCWGK
jgi:hypothetical protein